MVLPAEYIFSLLAFFPLCKERRILIQGFIKTPTLSPEKLEHFCARELLKEGESEHFTEQGCLRRNELSLVFVVWVLVF